MVFMDYLQQRKIELTVNITMDICNSYLKTLAGYSFKTIEQNVCGIRHFLRFQNFHWEDKKLSLMQHKTHKPLTLPIPDAVGWAVIDYIKNGRPQYYETDHVFLKPFSETFCRFHAVGNGNAASNHSRYPWAL